MEPHDEVALARIFDHDMTEEHPSVTARPFGQPWYEPWLDIAPEVRLVGNATLKDYYRASTHHLSNGPGIDEGWDPEERRWHQDGLPDAAPAPPRVGTLRAIRVPSTGGDTLFACTRHIAKALLADEARRDQQPAGSENGPLDPPASLARATYRRHANKQVHRDGVSLAAASGHVTPSHGPYPLIAYVPQGSNPRTPRLHVIRWSWV